MKLPDGFDLIVFDCDGLLVHSEALSMRTHQDLFAKLSLKLPIEVREMCFVHSQTEILAIVENAVGRVTPPELRAMVWRRTKALFAAELKRTPKLMEFLESLDAPGGVASSSESERIRFSLEVAGLLHFFDDRAFSASYVSRGKSRPDIFLHAAEKMGVAAESVAVAEDSPPDVVAARGGRDSHRILQRRACRCRPSREAERCRRPVCLSVLERSRRISKRAGHALAKKASIPAFPASSLRGKRRARRRNERNVRRRRPLGRRRLVMVEKV
jgi:HAD superfamily hydrolase (TIGR01509 family)